MQSTEPIIAQSKYMQLAKSAGNKAVTACVKFAQVRSVENARDCLFGLESYWFEHMI